MCLFEVALKVTSLLEFIRHYFAIFWRGMAMGAADVVPGVSGGTVAFITGIYSRLIYAIGSFRPSLLFAFIRNGKSLGWKQAVLILWKEIDGFFLSFLFFGIITSIVLLASVIKTGLEEKPIWVWSFFFGLIVSSIVILFTSLLSQANDLNPEARSGAAATLVSLVIGALFAWWLTGLPPAAWSSNPGPLVIALCASVAMCAMILPGISGSFILLLLGVYQPVLEAVTSRDLPLLLAFAIGGVFGLLSFVQLLKYLLKQYQSLVIAMMLGFLVGSLNKVWPWKETLSYNVNRHGDLVPLWQVNVSPFEYANATAAHPEFYLATMFGILGLMIGMLLAYAGRRMPQE